ncbi:MAG TPA: FtsW/RodA/SpoVE family cell cycle protein [Nakamurella sp.]|jgi:cell division protein FtsW (lipid II flippase)|nr:FtsW/RodA/SpoVE family cell cycle protein [Nakamurella sp.]
MSIAAALTPARRRTGRGAELGLLVFAGIIVTAALVIVELNQNQALHWELLYYGGGYLAVFAVAHLLTRALAPYADPLLLPLVALLNGIGLVMIYRLDLAAKARDADAAAQAPLQLLWTGIALLFFLAVLLVVRDHTTLQQYSYTLALLGVVFLAIPAALPSRFSEVNGAKIWIKIPGLLSIQPSEFAKIALIVFAAAFLVSKRTLLSTAGKRFLGLVLPRARDLGPLVVLLAVALAVLVFGNDLGTALLLFGVLLVMVYLTTGRVSWLIIGLLAFAGGAVLAYQLFAHLRVRVDIWLHPFADPLNKGYQLVQSLFGLGTGGIFGTGLGAGRPDIVPFASTDFITAALGEELGLVGLSAILLCYLLLVGRGLRTALAAKDNFGSLLAAGLSFAIALQVFIIVGGVTRLIPLTGLTTPFLSYGGSSLLANYIILALLLRISDSSRRPVVGRLPRAPRPAPLTQERTEVLPALGGDGA